MSKKEILITLLFLCFNNSSYSENLEHAFNSIEKILTKEKIVSFSKISINSKNLEDRPIYSVILESGIRAVFKVREKRNNIAEVAAYKASNFLKLYLVPPTVLRSINNLEGSLQFYIESSFPLCEYDVYLSKVNKKNKLDAIIFLFIFGQFDVNFSTGKNIIITKNHRLMLIDNEVIHKIQKVRYGELPYFILGSCKPSVKINIEFPFDDRQLLHEGCISSLSCHYNINFIRHFIKVGSKYYCIWQDKLWIQAPTKFQINYTNEYYVTTLTTFKSLTLENLINIWQASSYSKKSDVMADYKEIFELILERRDQVLLASKRGVLLN